MSVNGSFDNGATQRSSVAQDAVHRPAAEAFVTLVTTDPYCMGATAVARSLRHHGTTRRIVVMVTANVSEQSRVSLRNVFDEVITVELMDSGDRPRLSLLGRPELGVTFTKIHCWTLTQFTKCVFLDADTLVLCNVDELFERDELSAAPDPGWPDCFNSGVFVFRPSLHTHACLLDHALRHGSFDGGDQGLLNSFFSSWPVADISKHLPFVYNISGSSVYSYLPAFQQFGHSAKIVHFTGAEKPWSSSPQRGEGRSLLMEHFASLWWKEYLNYSTSLPSGKHIRQDPKDPRGSQQPEAKRPLSESLDSSNSLLAHFSGCSERVHSAPEHNTSSHTGFTPLGEEPRMPESTDLHEPQGSRDTAGTSAADAERDQLEHRRRWEEGEVDYLGQDAFRNIQKLLDCFLDSSSQ